MIENSTYTSPIHGVDEQGRHRTWPLPFGPHDPETFIPGWAEPVPDSLPILVEPGVLHDPMEVQR